MIGYDPDAVSLIEREIRSTGQEPLVCGRCGNQTLYPPGWSYDNGMDANGQEVCPLCKIHMYLISKGVIKDDEQIADTKSK